MKCKKSVQIPLLYNLYYVKLYKYICVPYQKISYICTVKRLKENVAQKN